MKIEMLLRLHSYGRAICFGAVVMNALIVLPDGSHNINIIAASLCIFSATLSIEPVKKDDDA